MNILALLLDWFLHFDQKLLIIPNAITNFFNGILLAFVNISSAVGTAIANFLNLIVNNIEEKGNALGNYFTNLGNSIAKAWNWVKDISGKILIYFIELFAYNPTKWFIEFAVALIMLSVEIVKDIVLTLFDYITTRVPATIIDAIFSIPGLNDFPAIGALKNALKDVIGSIFKVPSKIISPNIAGEIGKAVSSIAKKAADAAFNAAKSLFS